MIGKGYTMAWAPAPGRSVPNPFNGLSHGKSLGQRVVEHDNKITAIGMDALIAVGSGQLAWGLGTANNRWATFWWVVTGIATVKFLHDLSRP